MTGLNGRAVFLSASFPSGTRADRFRPFDPGAIADAATAMARAVLDSEGHLVFGAHPTISPLVLTVAGELDRPGLVQIYQSEYFRELVPDETLRLAELGFGEIVWTPLDEKGNRDASLALMRDQMLRGTRPVAGLFIGGMEGVVEEAGHLRDIVPRALHLPLAAPGGAARQLAARGLGRFNPLTDLLRSEKYPLVAREVVSVISSVS